MLTDALRMQVMGRIDVQVDSHSERSIAAPDSEHGTAKALTQVSIRQHTSAHVSIRQHTLNRPAYDSEHGTTEALTQVC